LPPPAPDPLPWTSPDAGSKLAGLPLSRGMSTGLPHRLSLEPLEKRARLLALFGAKKRFLLLLALELLVIESAGAALVRRHIVSNHPD
jgi:hypothetical protein